MRPRCDAKTRADANNSKRSGTVRPLFSNARTLASCELESILAKKIRKYILASVFRLCRFQALLMVECDSIRSL
eukprot:scaffold168_cov410-Prasinococcus_capsulatus_cf.AAC.7